jgi:hypothetical protein
LIQALDDGDYGMPLLDAATALADVRLCRALPGAKASGRPLPDDLKTSHLFENWKDAIAACGCEPSEN